MAACFFKELDNLLFVRCVGTYSRSFTALFFNFCSQSFKPGEGTSSNKNMQSFSCKALSQLGS